MKNTNNKKWEEIAKRSEEEIQQATIEVEKQEAEKTNDKTEEIDFLTHDKCSAKLTAMEKKAEEYQQNYTRALAELKNMQTRTERDIANAHKYGIEKFANELLPVVDNLERTLEIKVEGNPLLINIHAGIELTLKSFIEALQKFGVTQLNPINETFNPQYHSAISVQENASVKPNTVLQVLQKGYLLKDRLLRPAMVIVAK